MDAPHPEPLSFGRVIRVAVDDAPWHWADSSDEPLILNGFPPGPQEGADRTVTPNHQTLD
jgi:hypothetical protein